VDVYITEQVGECNNYIEEGKTKKETVTIIISPLRIETKEDTLKVVSGCSMFSSCGDRRCHYSAAARKLPKIKAREL